MPSGSDVRRVSVRIRIDATAVAFDETSGPHVASLDVAVFLPDRRLLQVGQLWQPVELYLQPEDHGNALQSGLPHETILDAPPDARQVKVVVYDPVADRLGSVTLAIR